jgi:hypothetical protein
VVALIKSIFKKNGQSAHPNLVKKILTLSERKCNEQWYTSTSQAKWKASTTKMISTDPFSPEKMGRLDALAAVELADQMSTPIKWQDNIKLAQHLKKNGFIFYGMYDCSKDSDLNIMFGREAFQQLRYIEKPNHQKTIGFYRKNKYINYINVSMEELADLSGYSVHNRNFQVPDEQKPTEEAYKKQKQLKASQSKPK